LLIITNSKEKLTSSASSSFRAITPNERIPTRQHQRPHFTAIEIEIRTFNSICYDTFCRAVPRELRQAHSSPLDLIRSSKSYENRAHQYPVPANKLYIHSPTSKPPDHLIDIDSCFFYLASKECKTRGLESVAAAAIVVRRIRYSNGGQHALDRADHGAVVRWKGEARSG
jgi:hypothetical protein